MIEVLLVSPRLPPQHPKYGGDNAYTDTLLQYPPPGVRYHHYEDLVTQGLVRKIKTYYRIGPRLTKWGILPPDTWAEYLESDFVPDLLHIVGFSAVVRFPLARRSVPTIIEAPSGSVSDLLIRLKWPEEKAIRAHRVKRAYLRLIDAYDSNLNSDRAARVIVQSDHSRFLHLKYGHVTSEKILVLRPGVPPARARVPQTDVKDSVTFLFVGSDFERKNGRLALAAFKRVRESYRDTRLILVGRPTDGQPIVSDGVEHYTSLPRSELFERIYPQADVFLFPTGAEGGFGVVIYEAMNFGLSVITVDAWAMREIVVPERTGILISFPPSEDATVEAMIRLLENPDLLAHMQNESLERFKSEFDLDVRQRRLGSIYRDVLE